MVDSARQCDAVPHHNSVYYRTSFLFNPPEITDGVVGHVTVDMFHFRIDSRIYVGKKRFRNQKVYIRLLIINDDILLSVPFAHNRHSAAVARYWLSGWE